MKENTAKKFISWRRVSTKKQEHSGLGLEAQKDIIDYFVKSENGVLIEDYVECYTGTDLEGCKELKKAMAHCKEIGATLIIAKTDRFRNTIEALQTYDDMNGNIFFCDLPSSDKFTLTLFFAISEREALMVSIRTKAALKVAKEKGKKLGAPTTDNIKKAQTASAEARIERARKDDKNIEFKKWLDIFEEEFGVELKRGCETKFFELFAERLNKYDKKTATGKDWNKKLVYEFTRKIKNRYGIAW